MCRNSIGRTLAAAAAVIIVAAFGVSAQTWDCGAAPGTVTATLSGNGILMVAGAGAMADFSDKDAPWHDSKGSIIGIAIGNGVISVGNGAFSDCSRLISVMIPNGVTSIGDGAFSGCTSLASAAIPSSVTSIGQGAFFLCGSLMTVTIGSGVTSINELAFSGCAGLKIITALNPIPPTLGENAFENNSACLNVPSGSVDAYRSAAGWKAFSCINASPAAVSADGKAADSKTVTQTAGTTPAAVLPGTTQLIPPLAETPEVPPSETTPDTAPAFALSGTTFTDSRDGKSYKWVQIGNQAWMAENLNYETPNSKCHGDDSSYCDKYGRLYSYNEALGACPAGWNLPADADWNNLLSFVDGGAGKMYKGNNYFSKNAGKYLKAKSGWKNAREAIPGLFPKPAIPGTGDDTYGFAALPGGDIGSPGGLDAFLANEVRKKAEENGLKIVYDETDGNWWSASESKGNRAMYYTLSNYSTGNNFGTSGKDNYFISVRCVYSQQPSGTFVAPQQTVQAQTANETAPASTDSDDGKKGVLDKTQIALLGLGGLCALLLLLLIAQ